MNSIIVSMSSGRGITSPLRGPVLAAARTAPGGADEGPHKDHPKVGDQGDPCTWRIDSRLGVLVG